MRLEQRGRLWQREWLIGHLDTRATEADSVLWFSPSLLGLLRRDYNEWQDVPCGNNEQAADLLLVAAGLWQALQSAGAQGQPDVQPVQSDVRRLSECLVQRQNPDGGWGWWPGDASRPLQTAQALEALFQAAGTGLVQFPSDSRERGLEAARRQLVAVEDRDLRVYLLSLASKGPSGQDVPVRLLWPGRGQLSTPALVHLGMALENIGELSAEDKADLVSELTRRATHTSSFVWWPASGGGGLLPDDDRFATALALEALLRWAPDDEVVGKSVEWLLRTTPAEDGRLSLSVARVLFALLGATRLHEEPTEGIVRVAQEGVPIMEEKVDESDPLAIHEVNLKDLRAGQNWVEILLEASGPLYFGWSIRYLLSDGASGPARSANGIALRRSYRRPDEGQPSSHYQVGQFVQVAIELNATQDLKYVVLEDAVPPGTRPIAGSVDAGDLAHSDLEVSPEGDRVSVLLPALPAGRHTLTYLLLAEAPAEVRVWPASAHPVNHPAAWGESAESELSIGE